jgi:hypothetical protein
MPPIARLTEALSGLGRGKALAYVGAAAALVGAGTASAATLAGGSQPAHHDTRVELVAARHTSAAGRGTTPAAAPAQPTKPYKIYDSVTPSSLPAGHQAATYADGAYKVSPSQVSGRQVLWIDTNGSDPHANVLDVEPGDATPSMAASWAKAKLAASPNSLACIYTMESDWGAAKAAISTLPSSMQSHVRWWIADPTGVPHIVPGASATQWYWGSNYDISSANSAL